MKNKSPATAESAILKTKCHFLHPESRFFKESATVDLITLRNNSFSLLDRFTISLTSKSFWNFPSPWIPNTSNLTTNTLSSGTALSRRILGSWISGWMWMQKSISFQHGWWKKSQKILDKSSLKISSESAKTLKGQSGKKMLRKIHTFFYTFKNNSNSS